MTRMVEMSIQVVSPLSGTGAAATGAAASAAGATASWAKAATVPIAPNISAPVSAVRAAVFKLDGMFIEISMETGNLARLERVGVGFAGADAHGVVERE